MIIELEKTAFMEVLAKNLPKYYHRRFTIKLKIKETIGGWRIE